MSINGSTSPTPTLNDEQANALVSVVTESPATQDLADVVKIILETGLRAGELRELRFADVDHDKRQLATSSTKSCTRRVVPCGPETLLIWKSRRERHPESEYVFGELRKGCIQRASRQLSGLAPQIGVLRLTTHTLRHTFFLRLLCGGAELAVVMAIAGWKSWGASTKFVMHHSGVEISRAYYSAIEKTKGEEQ